MCVWTDQHAHGVGLVEQSDLAVALGHGARVGVQPPLHQHLVHVRHHGAHIVALHKTHKRGEAEKGEVSSMVHRKTIIAKKSEVKKVVHQIGGSGASAS